MMTYLLRMLPLNAMCSAAAAWHGDRGAVVAFGTAAMFDGEALQRPSNAAACDLLFRWLRPVRRSILRHATMCTALM